MKNITALLFIGLASSATAEESAVDEYFAKLEKEEKIQELTDKCILENMGNAASKQAAFFIRTACKREAERKVREKEKSWWE
jgi:hypothetical protein